MELYILRVEIREEDNTNVARFMSRLSLEIRDRVELLRYKYFNNLVQFCIKVKQQNLKKRKKFIF